MPKNLQALFLTFLDTHFKVSLANCAPLGIEEEEKTSLKVYPNPQNSGSSIFIEGLTNGKWKYRIFNTEGKEIGSGNIEDNEISIKNVHSQGFILLLISNVKTGKTHLIKYILE